MARKWQWMAAAFWFWAVPHGEAAQFLAEVDKTQGSLEESFTLTLTIREAQNIPQPQLPAFADFDTKFQNQISQTQWIHGKIRSQVQFKYSLLPRKIGQLTIPAISVTLDKKRYQTDPIHLNVTPAPVTHNAEKPVFVQSTVSAEQAYPNQQILYTFELYLRKGLRVSQLRFERPELSAFHVEALGKQEPQIKRLGGQIYEVFRVPLVLYPLQVGTFVIPPATLYGSQMFQPQIQSLFDRLQPGWFAGHSVPFQLRTAPAPLKVLALPAENQPSDYYGLVGNYDLTATLSPQKLKAGESATLKIVVTGSGLAEWVRPPPLDFDPSLKIYVDQPTYESKFQGNQQISQTIFTAALVPSLSGTYRFPAVVLPFFDPQAQSFVRQEAPIPPLQVLPGESQELTSVGGSQARKVQRLGEDLLPIHRGAAALQNNSLEKSTLVGYGFLLGLAPLCFGVGWLWQWKRAHAALHHEKIRHSQAFSQFERKVKTLHAEGLENEPFAPALMLALKGYIGDKANKWGEALTAQEINQWLQEKQATEALRMQMRTLLEQCESAQYAAHPLSTESKEQIYQSAQTIVRQLEAQLK